MCIIIYQATRSATPPANASLQHGCQIVAKLNHLINFCKNHACFQVHAPTDILIVPGVSRLPAQLLTLNLIP